MQRPSSVTDEKLKPCDEDRAAATPAHRIVAAELSREGEERMQIEMLAAAVPPVHDGHAGETALIKEFFSAPSAHAPCGDTVQDEVDSPASEALSGPDSRRGMYATFAILLVGSALIGGFLVYNKLLMPAPEELVGGGVVLPTPAMLRPGSPQVEPGRAAREAPHDASKPKVAEAMDMRMLATEAREAFAAPAASAGNTLPGPFGVRSSVASSAAAHEPRGPSLDYYQALKKARALGFRRAAERAYLDALELEPADRSDALSGLAMLYLNQGKNVEARAYARRAVAIDGKSSEGWIVLAAALSALRDDVGATKAYRACAAFPPDKYVLECKRMLR